MADFEGILKESECYFNWDLTNLVVQLCVSSVEYFKNKVEVSESIENEETEQKWPLKLTYAYELSNEDMKGALVHVDEVIQEILTSSDAFIQKYQVPIMHIVWATKAFMLQKIGEFKGEETKKLIDFIKPKNKMSDEEWAALMAIKAHILRLYGPDGTYKGVPLLRQAIQRNPQEVEWQISLVVSKNRIRHYVRGTDTPWSEVEEVVNIVENLLNHPNITSKQVITCKYYLAVAYRDYILGKKSDENTKTCKKQILSLCNEICEESNQPQTLAFCAEQFDKNGNTTKAMEIFEKALKLYPTHTGINVTACNVHKRRSNYALAAEYAQRAKEQGAFAGVWLLLECKEQLKQAFDEEAFFDEILSSFPLELYVKQTHLNAALLYFLKRGNAEKGAYHLEQAIRLDPQFKGIHGLKYCPWVKKKIRPIQVAYQEIVRGLRSDESNQTLLSAKRAIEQVAEAGSLPNMDVSPPNTSSEQRSHSFRP